MCKVRNKYLKNKNLSETGLGEVRYVLSGTSIIIDNEMSLMFVLGSQKPKARFPIIFFYPSLLVTLKNLPRN